MKITKIGIIVLSIGLGFLMFANCEQKAGVTPGEPGAPQEVAVPEEPGAPAEEGVPAVSGEEGAAEQPAPAEGELALQVLLKDDSTRELIWPLSERPKPTPLNARIKITLPKAPEDRSQEEAKFRLVMFQVGDVLGIFSWPDDRTMIFTPERVLTGWATYEVWYEGEQRGQLLTPVPFDVNGDGYADSVVSAANNDRAYFIAGQPALGSIDFSYRSVPTFTGSNQFGRMSSIVGDLNADGYHDIVIQEGENRLIVFFGQDSFEGEMQSSSAPVRIAFLNSIRSIAAHDIGGDGYVDLAVAEQVSAQPPVANVYLISGTELTSGILPAPGIKMPQSKENADLSGHAVAFGDINGDGVVDLIVSRLEMGSGRVRVFYGPSFSDSDSVPPMVGIDQFGIALTTADLNNDRIDDLIVGAPAHDNDLGRVYVYFGGSAWSSATPLILDGTTADERFGSVLASIGDVDGDGHEDVAVGAPMLQSQGINFGRAARFYFDGSQLQLVDLKAEIDPGHFGSVVAAAGDLNGDDILDFIVASPEMLANKGRAYVFSGDVIMPTMEFTGAAGDMLGAGMEDEFPVYKTLPLP